jgi:hypothetical protein
MPAYAVGHRLVHELLCSGTTIISVKSKPNTRSNNILVNIQLISRARILSTNPLKPNLQKTQSAPISTLTTKHQQTYRKLCSLKLVTIPASVLAHSIRPLTTAQAVVIAVDNVRRIDELHLHAATGRRWHSSPDSEWDVFVGIRTVDCTEREGGEQTVGTPGLADFHGSDVAFGLDMRGAVETGEGGVPDEGDVTVTFVLELDGHGVGRHCELWDVGFRVGKN